MTFDINDFPAGTQISMRYLYPLADYFNTVAPDYVYAPNFDMCSTSAFGENTGGHEYVYLPFQTIDWSRTKTIEFVGTIPDKILVDGDLRFSFPSVEKLALKHLAFTTVGGTKQPLNIYVENLDKVKSISSCFYGDVNIISYSGESKELTTLGGIMQDMGKYNEFHFNIDCSKLTSLNPFYYQTHNETVFLSGFPNMKASLNSSYTFALFPNLTRESCISILENLYDFVGNNETPSSSQGKIKVHANFLTAVGDDISIATNKGWTITT